MRVARRIIIFVITFVIIITNVRALRKIMVYDVRISTVSYLFSTYFNVHCTQSKQGFLHKTFVPCNRQINGEYARSKHQKRIVPCSRHSLSFESFSRVTRGSSVVCDLRGLLCTLFQWLYHWNERKGKLNWTVRSADSSGISLSKMDPLVQWEWFSCMTSRVEIRRESHILMCDNQTKQRYIYSIGNK